MTDTRQETQMKSDALRAMFNRRAAISKWFKIWLVYAVFVVSISAIAGLVMISQGMR